MVNYRVALAVRHGERAQAVLSQQKNEKKKKQN